MTDTQKLIEAIKNLRDHQNQIDYEGIMVGVSREALDTVLAHLAQSERAEAANPPLTNEQAGKVADVCPFTPLESLTRLADVSEKYNGKDADFNNIADALTRADRTAAQVDVEALKLTCHETGFSSQYVYGYNECLDHITTHYTLTKKEI